MAGSFATPTDRRIAEARHKIASSRKPHHRLRALQAPDADPQVVAAVRSRAVRKAQRRRRR